MIPRTVFPRWTHSCRRCRLDRRRRLVGGGRSRQVALSPLSLRSWQRAHRWWIPARRWPKSSTTCGTTAAAQTSSTAFPRSTCRTKKRRCATSRPSSTRTRRRGERNEPTPAERRAFDRSRPRRRWICASPACTGHAEAQCRSRRCLPRPTPRSFRGPTRCSHSFRRCRAARTSTSCLRDLRARPTPMSWLKSNRWRTAWPSCASTEAPRVSML